MNSPGVTVQNNFNGGLKTEATGLNFPENSCTSLSNCVISLIGDIFRREGIDYEVNAVLTSIDRTNSAINSYRWTNVGGDGLTQVVVVQVGSRLYFFQQTNATIAQPLSTTLLASTVDISQFLVNGSSANPAITECQFTDGNGYLFVFHPNLEPFYCTFNAGTIVATTISIQIRDFMGLSETGVPVNFRPLTLSVEHNYNLVNQGWTTGASWSTTSTTVLLIGTGPKSFTVASGITGVSNGQNVTVTGNASGPGHPAYTMSGTVTSYAGTTLTLNITSASGPGVGKNTQTSSIAETNAGFITTWFSAEGNYPSNSDVWWRFKDTSNVFNPATTQPNVSINTGQAPQGHFLLSAFNQDRSSVSGVAGLTSISTMVRPKTGTWFQGRVWYTGVDASVPASGDALYTTWTENIYFSQVTVPGSTTQFGNCYQVNDPTSEDLFGLLPTDGGVIVIQGSGSIYKLFPMQTGMLVFAANGIWFITGGQGGFAADNYTISKISNVQSITSTGFVNVLGYPMFWNEEGIYYVAPSKQAGSQHTPDIGLDVQNLALGTFLTFYSNIPVQSKKYVRGDYDPLGFVVSWVYRSTNETNVKSRYEFDSQLNYNTANKAMYPYTIGSSDDSTPWVHDIKYIVGPGGSTSPDPTFKYLTSNFNNPGYSFTFSEEHDSTHFTDWFSSGDNVNYVSSFIAGYNIKGAAMRRWQPGYVYVFSKPPNAYKVNGVFDYGTTGLSGKISQIQVITNSQANFGVVFRRHRIRGRGLVFQLEINSVDGQNFDIIGWSIFENISAGV